MKPPSLYLLSVSRSACWHRLSLLQELFLIALEIFAWCKENVLLRCPAVVERKQTHRGLGCWQTLLLCYFMLHRKLLKAPEEKLRCYLLLAGSGEGDCF